MKKKRISALRLLKMAGLIAFLWGLVLLFDYNVGFRRTPSSLTMQGKTKHFHFYTDADKEMLAYYMSFFEGFHEYIDSTYFKIKPRRRLKVYLFSDDRNYDPFMESTCEVLTPYGFYMGPWSNTLAVNADSGLGTSTHELLHHFIQTSFVERPPAWAEEGVAAFFEKFMGHFDEDRKLHISFGYFSNWRFPITKKGARWLNLEQLMQTKPPEQCAARSLMLFLHKQGLFEEFVLAMSTQTTDPSGEKTLQKVCQKDLNSIEEEWKNWVIAQPLDEEVDLIPASFVLSAEQWQDWLKANQGRLIWNKSEQRFSIRR